MFSKFKEKNLACVELKDITDPRVMTQVIHYMYFNAVSLHPASVQDILSIANYLQIENLTHTCVEFVKNRYGIDFKLLVLVTTEVTGAELFSVAGLTSVTPSLCSCTPA